VGKFPGVLTQKIASNTQTKYLKKKPQNSTKIAIYFMHYMNSACNQKTFRSPNIWLISASI
jgi:hypothetical protein